VKTNHRNLIYLANSNIPKLVRWRVLLSEFQFSVVHIPGKENVIADGMTRVFRTEYATFYSFKRSVHVDDTILRIFRLEGEGMTPADEGQIESDSEDYEWLEPVGPIESHAIFAKFHNSSVGHFGVENTLKTMAAMGHGWRGMRKDVRNWISECAICQKIKYQRDPQWQDALEHHLHRLKPLASLSIDTLGPLPEDEHGNSYVIVIVDNFSKFIGLYPARRTTSEEFVRALLQWVGVFGIPEEIRTDGGSQFNSKLATDFKSLLKYEHLVVFAYRPQANGIAERRMTEVMKHIRALVYENRIKCEVFIVMRYQINLRVWNQSSLS
jgi:Integrase zinc binding domain/Integrase core domain